MIKELTSKEKLFCTYYSVGCNEREAAARSGYMFPDKAGVKLMKKKEVLKYIAELDTQTRTDKKDIAQGYVRLAFGCASDAIKLLFCDDLKESDIEKLDFYNISQIRRKKGGDIEIKFFDRLDALDRLRQLCDEKEAVTGNSLFSAIAASAGKLREKDLG